MRRNSMQDPLHKSKTMRMFAINSFYISESPFVRFKSINGENTSKDWVEE